MTAFLRVIVAGLVVGILGTGCSDDTTDVVPFKATEEVDEPPDIPTDSPIRHLRVRLESVPEEIEAGDDLAFVAVLENPTNEDISLEPCPAYHINYGESATVVSTQRRLNCGGGDRVSAGGSLSFEMRISTDAQFIEPGGDYRLVWRLEPDVTGTVTHVATLGDATQTIETTTVPLFPTTMAG